MKRGHCQDGKNTSAPFYLFPQHWDCGTRLGCMKKDSVCGSVEKERQKERKRERERLCMSKCVSVTDNE